MSCATGCKTSGLLCPVSLGLALGLTCALSVYVWMAWTMWFGVSPSMAGHMLPPSTFVDASMMAGRCLLKGFFFGFVFALIYDLIRCCCKARCCKKDGNGCGCGNPNCNCQCNSKANKN